MLSFQTVFPHTLELLRQLTAEPLFAELRLVGGTALALQYGHRRSVDLDFFGDLPRDTSRVAEVLSEVGEIVQGQCSDSIKTFRIDGVKVDFVNYTRYPWIDDPVLKDGLRLASPKDIAAMKINAVQGRGSRKDFVDMFFLLRHYSIDDIMEFYKSKYPEHSEFRAMLSLSYFGDADPQPMPEMFSPISWDEMKDDIRKAVEDYNRRHR